ncbi:hypothetical protein N7532_008576 [Penicillium argentinense]|uniref:Bys1 family protein n=1 Tax=Penicillium argentinense TaxID=1131581 RepID=A0A9W9EXN5_9EURO|nr:uncharacterized protein N7532_008576 [Penicillium argentinense]KAJ5089892.1 hypothetical protein N7532_008576 [Penicillium argentinense]
MRFPLFVSILSLATLAFSRPTVQDVNNHNDPIPYGAFPSSASSSITPATTPGNPNYNSTRIGRAIVLNRCPKPVYIWSVGSIVRPETTVLPGGRFTETFRRDLETGGIALKISTVKGGLYKSAPQTIFAYNLNGNKVWYDLSDVFGDPFRGRSVSLLPSSPPISWSNGIPPHGSQVRVQDSSQDLTLTLC